MRYLAGFVLISLLTACGSISYQTGSTTADKDPKEGDVTVLAKKTCKNIFDTIGDVDDIIDLHDRPGDKEERDKWCDVRRDLEDSYIKANCTDLMLPPAPTSCVFQ